MIPMQSEQIDQLMKAIFEMHKKYGCVIEKNAKSNRGRYADLPRILSTIHKWCKEFDLDLIQPEEPYGDKLAIRSIVTHIPSGQWRASVSLLTCSENSQNPDQAYGGSSTYHRRYSGMSLLGLFAADDPLDHDGDDESVQDAAPAQDKPRQFTNSTKCITEKQIGFFNVKSKKNPSVANEIIRRYGSVDKIPMNDFNAVLAELDGKAPSVSKEQVQDMFGGEFEEVY